MKINRLNWKSFFTQPRLILNLLLLSIFSAAWIHDLLYWLPKDMFGTSLNYWAYTDWLIDYSQGFIRRGLSGELWRLIPATVPRLELVAVFSWTLILVVVFGYLRLLARSWKSLHPLVLFGLLFLPSLFVFYLHDHNAIARKETLGYIAILLHLLVVEKTFPIRKDSTISEGKLRGYVGWMIPISLILLPAIILIHEGNFLLFVPLHGLITLTVLRLKGVRGFIKAVLWSALFYVPAMITFIAVYLTGTPSYSTLLGICQNWLAIGALREGSCFLFPDKLSGSTLPGSLIPMQWSLERAFEITSTIIAMHWKAWLLILPTLGVSIWYLVRQAVYSMLRSRSTRSFPVKSASKYAGSFFVKFFVIPLLLSLPVYLTAYDYGRWFTVTCINYTLVAVSLNLPFREFLLCRKESDEVEATTSSLEHLDHRLIFYGVLIIICLLALILWLPHYCLFSCEIIQSPLQFFSHTFIAN